MYVGYSQIFLTCRIFELEYRNYFIAKRLSVRHIIVWAWWALMRPWSEVVLVCMFVCMYVCP